MTPVSEFIANRVPADAVVLEAKVCENCTRPLYRIIGKNKKVCIPCSGTFEFGAQIWVCMECEMPRKWGEGQPDDKSAKRLKCVRCTNSWTGAFRITRHEFFEVSRGRR